MVLFDTNMILRYLLNDNQQMADQAERLLSHEDVAVFVDCVLFGYHQVKGFDIATFDKKLLKLLTSANE